MNDEVNLCFAVWRQASIAPALGEKIQLSVESRHFRGSFARIDYYLSAARHPRAIQRFRSHSKCYLELIDWSGRIVRPDKYGAIDSHAPPILSRLSVDPAVWRDSMALRGNVFGRALGKLDHLRLHAKALGQQRIKGLWQAQRLFRCA